MIRGGLVLLLIAIVAVTILALTGDAGRASVVWLGWRADMTAATAVLLTLLTSLLATIVWRTLLWILEAPRRAERSRAELRRRQGIEALTRGFTAAAAGDGAEARRLARKAAELATDAPGLARLLAAQAAEAAGDAAAAEAAYTAMLGIPEMRLAGHRGLMLIALQRGERAAALQHAQDAYGQARSARWAWRALLEARLEAADWSGALELVKAALDRKVVPPIVAERTRAALLAALAAQLEAAGDAKSRGQALDHAVDAAKLQPGFAPGVVMAARLLAAEGKPARAAGAIEAAWREAPHPALYLAYRDLVIDETPRARAERLLGLASQNPTHRESRILSVERALLAGDAPSAREAAETLASEPLTARLAGLFARVAYAAGDADEARVWLARGVSAAQEPDWSDLDPEGRAFDYAAADWARLAITYGETGELIHPRLERREKGMGELPDLPISYADSAPFVAPFAAEAGEPPAPFPLDDGGYAPDEPPVPPPPPERRRRTPGRRRLASGPRAAK